MNVLPPILWFRRLALAGVLFLLPGLAVAVRAAEPAAVATIVSESIIGTVEVSRAGSRVWDRASAGNPPLMEGDQIRTAQRSQVALRLVRDQSVVQLGELSHARLSLKETRTVVEVLRGVMSFFHRDKPGTLEVQTGTTVALVRGTEFAYAAGPDGNVVLTLLDGDVELGNPLGRLEMRGGEVATAGPTQKPQRTAMLAEGPAEAIQWQLYYPAILDPDELGLPAELQLALAEVLARYRTGDLLGALAAYPPGRVPVDPREQILLAGLVLAVGDVSEAERLLGELPDEPTLQRFASALRQLIAAAQLRPCPQTEPGSSPAERFATEWLALSYCRQAARDMDGALAAAREAAARRPEFGFAWSRVAALEFGFGRIRAAQSALDRALVWSPRNAAAVTLSGFMAAARFQSRAAVTAFDTAIGLDPKFADAWLGRGLVRMRAGQPQLALSDLTLAAAIEPQRGVLRSYLGRGYAVDHQLKLAGHELQLARQLDPQDPTAWLFSALLHQQESRINEAIRDFNQAEELTDERAVYRSRRLLDQDRAMVGANRATAYHDGGLEAVARREAGRALSQDATSAGAHRFLADSYATSERVNLRYESARAAEYLQANLLAPVGGGPLSASISQQDYSPLFEQDGPHGFSTTTYQGVGGWEQTGGIYGATGRLGYAADAYYANGDGGVVSNTDFEQTAVEAQAKIQASDRDRFYVQVLESWLDAGDLATYDYATNRNADLRVNERLNPILLAGWHRAWTPEHHTLVLAGWLDGNQQVDDPTTGAWLFGTNLQGQLVRGTPVSAGLGYQAETSWLSLEAQHLWETPVNTLIVGAKFQSGRITAQNQYDNVSPPFFQPQIRPARTYSDSDASRVQVYAYETWRLTDTLALTAGLSADWLQYPVNFRNGPLSDEEEDASQVSPKAGVVWQPLTNLWLRGAYTRSLGGIGLEQSIRLEPTQVAGFNQTFRSLMPESVVGSLSAAQNDTGNVAAEVQLRSGTLLGLEGEWLRAVATQGYGAYIYQQGPTVTDQELTFTDRSLTAYVGQLLGRDWTLFLRYRAGVVDFEESFPGLAPGALDAVSGLYTQADTQITTQAVTLSGRYNHPSGWFAGADATWTYQTGSGQRALPDDTVWMLNAFVGHRFWERRVEVTVGVENLAGQDYVLSPLTLIAAPPRERSFFAQLKWTY